MEDYETRLIEWTIFYAKNKDIIKKEIKDYKILKNFVEFEYKDKKHTYHVYPELTRDATDISKDGWKTLVCLNKQKNLKFLLDNWKELIQNPKLSIIFVNPTSENRWIIFPHTHDKIAEKESLKAGLKTLFEGVEEV